MCCSHRSLQLFASCHSIWPQQSPQQAGGGPLGVLLQEQQVVQDRVVRVPLRPHIRPPGVRHLLDVSADEVKMK